jgi:hypothetical protein
MIVKIGNDEFSFTWQHVSTGRKRGTYTFVKRNKELIGQVRSHLDSRDVFIKRRGRVKSLTKALRMLTETDPERFTRQARTAIWTQYGEMIHQNWT